MVRWVICPVCQDSTFLGNVFRWLWGMVAHLPRCCWACDGASGWFDWPEYRKWEPLL